MTIKTEPQRHFEEVAIHDPALLDAIETVITTRDAVSQNRRARKRIRQLINGHPPGRYRCGSYVLDVSPMTGGGYEVAAWSTLAARIIEG